MMRIHGYTVRIQRVAALAIFLALLPFLSSAPCADTAGEMAALYDRVMNNAAVSAETKAALAEVRANASALAASSPERANLATSQLFAQYATQASDASRLAARHFVGGVNRRLTVLHDEAREEGPVTLTEIDRLWIGTDGTWTRQKNRDGKYGYEYDTQGLTVGYDRQRGDLTYGASAGALAGRLKGNDEYSRTDVESFHVGVYASYDPVSGIFIDANLGFGYSRNKASTIFIAGGGESTDRFNSMSFGAGANAGYTLCLQNGTAITPTLGIQWTQIHQNSRTESGVAAHWFDSSTEEFFEVPLAVRLERSFQLRRGTVLTPEVRAAWVHSFGDTQTRVTGGWVGSGDSATIHGVDSGKSTGLIGAGMKVNFSSFVDAFVDYNLEFRNGYRNSNLATGMGLSF